MSIRIEKGWVCRWTTEGYLVSQHNWMQSNKIHSIQAAVQSRSHEPRRTQAQKHQSFKKFRTFDRGRPHRTRHLASFENLEAYQEETRKWRNKKVVNRDIAKGDWVLKRKPNAETIGKLQSKWDGPYIVLYSIRPGSYHLADIEGNEL